MKTRIIIASLLAIAALIAIPIGASADTEEVNKTIVSFEPIQAQAGPCITEGQFRTGAFTRLNNDTSFIVSATLLRPLCEPLLVKAAIYDMPGEGAVPFRDWPQELVSVIQFTVSDAGTYTVQFEKICRAQQYDIIVGETPQTISPWGLKHGPLLFLNDWNEFIANSVALQFLVSDTSSALQFFPSQDCITGTTSTSSTSSTSSSTSTSSTSSSTSSTSGPTTTTTTEPDTTTTVAGTSVTSDPTTTTTSTDPEVPTSVLGTIVERPIDGTDSNQVQVAGISVGGLPVTGSETFMLAGLAVVLLAGGTMFVVSTRRRRISFK